MFGYVNVNQQELKLREFDRYRGFYCGLCHSLRNVYGLSSRMSLSYDMTFLVMLLTSLYEPKSTETRCSCPIHPIQKHLEIQNRFSAYAADMNILCTWYLSQDKILDADDKKSYLKGNALSLLYRQAFKQLKLKYPAKIRRIEQYLQQLKELENASSTDLDLVSGLSGQIVSEFFMCRRDEWTSTLQALGFHLGKFICLMDAFEDLERDLKNGTYNPLTSLYNSSSSEASFQETCKDYLTVIMADCAAQFERLPLIEDIDILRNIIYSGVWTRFELISQKRYAGQEKRN